jgi:hypothetical protein
MVKAQENGATIKHIADINKLSTDTTKSAILVPTITTGFKILGIGVPIFELVILNFISKFPI